VLSAKCSLPAYRQDPGIGPVTASALIATIGKANNFENGRQLAAWLGLVPRQHSSGGKQVLLGISKRGDTYLRTLLIHGARAVLQSAKHKQDAVSSWANQLMARRNNNIASVALANKNARTVWALLAKEREYCTNNKRLSCLISKTETTPPIAQASMK
jgi:transposase